MRVQECKQYHYDDQSGHIDTSPGNYFAKRSMLTRALAITGSPSDDASVRVLSVMLSLAIALPVNPEPLYDQDNGVFSGMFHFPLSTEGAWLKGARQHAFSLNAITSSHSTDEEFGDETLVLDGETTRVTFDYRYGLSDRFEIGIRLPYVWHESGSLDSLVKDWHDALGLPLGKRRDRDNNQLEFSYRAGTESLFDYQSNSNGPGDVRLLAGWQLKDGPNYSSALRFGLKLPTGDPDDFHGSGGTDASVGIAGDWKRLFGIAGLSGFYRAHLNYIGEPDVLADRYEDFVGQLSFGAGYQLSRVVDLRLQASGRTANYDSAIEILGQESAWITFGARFRLSSSYSLDLAVAEDIKVRSAPDVSFIISVISRSSPRRE
jgi:hypothetical protein